MNEPNATHRYANALVDIRVYQIHTFCIILEQAMMSNMEYLLGSYTPGRTMEITGDAGPGALGKMTIGL